MQVDTLVRLRRSGWQPPLLPPGMWRLDRPTVRSANRLVFLVPLGQIAILLWVIWTRTAHVPYWDEWETVLIVQHFQQGTLTWQELWAPHNVHRILAPRLLDLALIELTHWNRQVEMTFDLGVGCATAMLLLSTMARTVKTSAARYALVVPCSLLLLSFAESENWFAPFQIAFIATALGAACCVWGLYGRPVGWRRLSVALAGATLALASSLPGILLWPAFLPSVLKLERRKVAVWCACGIVQWAVYLVGFPHSPIAVHAFNDLIFVLVYLGAPVGLPSPSVAMVAGACGVGLFAAIVVVQRRRHTTLRRVDAWICLAIFVLACSLVTALGRGFFSSFSSRYVAFSGLWWVALFVVSAVMIEDIFAEWKDAPRSIRWSSRRVVLIAASLAVMTLASLGLVLSNTSGLGTALRWQDQQRAYQESVVHFASAPDSCLLLYYPSPDLLRQRAAFLATSHLAIFSGPATTVRSDPYVECPKP